MRHWRAASDPRLLWLLLGVVAAAYGPALGGPFQFDDYNVIVDNPAVHSLSAWLDAMPGIRPLLKLSYALNWTVSPQPLGFHLVNIGCHLLNTLLVWAIVARLWPEHLQLALVAPITAALFALHPAQTEAVTYICGRSVSLMALPYLAGIYAWLRGLRAASLVCLLLALLVRETAWTLPLALVLIALGRGASLRTALYQTRAHWVMLLFGMTLLAAIADYRQLLAHSLGIRGMGANLVAQVAAQFYLLTKPLLQLRTNIDPVITLETYSLMAQAFALGALYAAAAICLRWPMTRGLGAAVLWLFVHLLPTNSLLPRNDLANDRQLYLALLGPALVCAHGLVQASHARIAAAVLVLVLAVATAWRNTDYRSEIALWQATAARSAGSARVWNNLGFAYQQAGKIAEARSAYERALALDPASVRARINLNLLPPPPGDGTPAGK